MRFKCVRGGSIVELALLIPFVLVLSCLFLNLVFFALQQIRLERLAGVLVRELGTTSLQTAGEMRSVGIQWLSEHGLADVEPMVILKSLPTLSRPFPRRNQTVRVIELTLHWPARPMFPFFLRESLLLSSHTREVFL